MKIDKQKGDIAQIPTSVVLRRIEEENAKLLRMKPATPMSEYAVQVVRQGSWIIKEQPAMKLPGALSELIGLSLRDEGNELIEETRQFNNRNVGRSSDEINAELVADVEIMDLRSRVLDWTERATKQVLYKCRRKIEADPVGAYNDLFESIVRDIDTRIASGDDRLYQQMWNWAVDCMAYLLLDGCLLQPGFCEIEYTSDSEHNPSIKSKTSHDPGIFDAIGGQIHLFGNEVASYNRDIVFLPLSRTVDTGASIEDVRAEYHSNLSDLVEAFPYLLSSSRSHRYTFAIPGTTCFGAFRFLGTHGFASFLFCDTEEDLRRGLETNGFRGGVNIDYIGAMSCLMHPWLTLDRTLPSEKALRVAHWLLKQVHGRVVDDYLKINRYYLAPEAKLTIADPSLAAIAGDLDYVAWVKEIPQSDVDDAPSEIVRSSRILPRSPLAQIRKNRFFKVLRACGVEIAQGKGSEIKLLRGDAHPFRLGNHYGPNPTIPTFLAARILKRLGITHEQWEYAIKVANP